MDRNLLENILNDFPNIQRDEEFYRDISGLMEPMETGEFLYTELSLHDFLRSKGLLKLTKEKKDNLTEVYLNPRTYSLSLGKTFIINKDLLEEEIDLEEKVIRLSRRPDQVVSEIASPIDTSLDNLDKLGDSLIYRGQGKEPDKGEVYTIVPKTIRTPNGTEATTFHWTLPEPSDFFMQPKGRNVQVTKYRTHERAEPEMALTPHSELTPDELTRHVYGNAKNLSTYLKIGSEDKETEKKRKGDIHLRRFYVPVQASHGKAGYVRFYRDMPNGEWDAADDSHNWARIIAIAEKLHGTGEKISPKDIIEFIRAKTDLKSYPLENPQTLVDFRPAIDAYKEDLPNVTPLSEKERENMSVGDILTKHHKRLIFPHLKFPPEKEGADPKIPIRDLESYGKTSKEGGEYKTAIEALVKHSRLEGGTVDKPAIEHLMDHIMFHLPSEQVKLNKIIDDPRSTAEDIAKEKRLHDNLVLTYLSRHLGTRPGGTKGSPQGLITIQHGNIFRGSNGDIRLIFEGKGGSIFNQPITNPIVKKLLLNQAKLTERLHAKKDPKQRGSLHDEPLFSTDANFFNDLKHERSPLHGIISRLGLSHITPYNFRHYRATEVGIREAQLEGQRAFKRMMDESLSKLSPQERVDALHKIYNSNHPTYDPQDMANNLDFLATGIANKLNHHLSHVPSSAAWLDYIAPEYMRAAYLKALKQMITAQWKKDKASVS